MDIDEDDCGDCWVDKKSLDMLDFKVYEKLGRKVLSKNPHLNTFHKLAPSSMLATKPCPLQQIRVLILIGCQELEIVDLGNFHDLRSFIIVDCSKLKVVNGLEGAKGLGWIDIYGCPSYCSLPDVQFLSSLKEFLFQDCGGLGIPWQLANFTQCVQLRRLEIECDYHLVGSMDLKTLKFLEVLSFAWCKSLCTIHGLSELQTLMKLRIARCKSLKMVPDLGCLKALTYLDMSYSGIVEILGVEELHLLTWLELCCCLALESLPPLGHLKALAHLKLNFFGIEEIPGAEDLVSLEALQCYGSKLKQLPNLGHLLKLGRISIGDTPLSRVDPSRSFIEGYELIHNGGKKEGVFVDDISDISSDED